MGSIMKRERDLICAFDRNLLLLQETDLFVFGNRSSLRWRHSVGLNQIIKIKNYNFNVSFWVSFTILKYKFYHFLL